MFKKRKKKREEKIISFFVLAILNYNLRIEELSKGREEERSFEILV